MDFNLADWLNNILGVKNEVSVPIIVSVIIFAAGGIAVAIKNLIINFIQRWRTRNAFKNIMKEVAKACYSKSCNIKIFYPKIEMKHDKDWSLKLNAITYLSIAFNQDYTTIYNAFNSKFIFSYKSKFKTHCFNKLWAVLENIKFIEERIVADFDLFYKKFNQHEVAYTEYLEQFRKENDLFMTEIQRGIIIIPKTETRTIEYVTKRDLIVSTWQKMEERTELYNTHEYLIEPLRALNREYSEIIFSVKLNDILLPASHEYGQMLKTLQVYKSIFENYCLAYRRGHIFIKYCIDKI